MIKRSRYLVGLQIPLIQFSPIQSGICRKLMNHRKNTTRLKGSTTNLPLPQNALRARMFLWWHETEQYSIIPMVLILLLIGERIKMWRNFLKDIVLIFLLEKCKNEEDDKRKTTYLSGFYFQIFYPETTDVYDRKNMPKVVYCIHALR